LLLFPVTGEENEQLAKQQSMPAVRQVMVPVGKTIGVQIIFIDKVLV
jgi:hypothetical protein